MTLRWRAAFFFLPVWLLCLALLPGLVHAKLSVRSAMNGCLTSTTQVDEWGMRVETTTWDAFDRPISRTRIERWSYDSQDRLVSHTTPERTITWQLDAGGRRLQQTVVATVGATGPPNALEARAAEPIGTQTYSYNERDQLTQISGARAISYTYDANGNRLTQTETQGANSQTTRYHWNAQDQLVKVEQGTGGNPQLLASYRYNADNLRAEKILGDAGLDNAAQGSGAANTALAYERIQWDGLHARRSYEITGANNTTQTLRSDTDAAIPSGNAAPILFNRTTYANGVGSASSTTQLHADSQGTVIATVLSEAGAAKADSLLIHSPYGLIDSEASGNAGAGLRSNGNAFGSYYADPETGLLYARARYYDPASGQFVSRDPVEGEANLPITWGAYQYGRYNPYRYTDPNGEIAILADGAQTLGGWGDWLKKYGEENYAEGNNPAAINYGGKGLLGIGRGIVGGAEGITRAVNVVGNLTSVGLSAGLDVIGLGLPGSQAHLEELKGTARAVRQVADYVKSEGAAGTIGKATDTLVRAATGDADAAGDVAAALTGIGGLSGAQRTVQRMAAGMDKALATAGSSAAKSRVVGRAMEEMVAKADPALAAKTPVPIVEPVQPRVNGTTGTLTKEGPGLDTAGELQPQVRTAGAKPSGTVPEVGSPMGGVANSASELGAAPQGGSLLDPYAGVKDASAYLKSMGVSRAQRKQILESFEIPTLSVETAGENLYGLRFHDFGKTARPEGQYLFETFTPQTNRAGLALPPEWNGMTGVKQWQITPGATVIRGRAGPQFEYGAQYGGGAEQMFVLEPWKYGSLK